MSESEKGTGGVRRDDAALVAAALAGGPEQFGPVVARYQDAVFAVALARLRRFHDAEDVAQAVFLEAYERLDKLSDPGRLGAWLRSIAIHKSIDRLRGRREEEEIGADDEEGLSGKAWRAEHQRRTLREEVMAAIGRLSQTQRETTTLFYINGYSVEEVAGIQAVPVGTVTRRLHEARERLKEEMVGMVENVLKSEAPKPDFAARVFEILNRHHPTMTVTDAGATWAEMLAELRKIGTQGVEGFIRALESPHGKTRAFAVNMLGHAKPKGEVVVDLLKRALGDPNRKVRRFAVDALLYHPSSLAVSEDRKRAEIIPLVAPLLRDRSDSVRRRAAWQLERWARDVPLEAVAQALLETKNPSAAVCLRRLMRKVLEARNKPGGKKRR